MFLVKRIVGLRVLYIYSFTFGLVELGKCTRKELGTGSGAQASSHQERLETSEPLTWMSKERAQK